MCLGGMVTRGGDLDHPVTSPCYLLIKLWLWLSADLISDIQDLLVKMDLSACLQLIVESEGESRKVLQKWVGGLTGCALHRGPISASTHSTKGKREAEGGLPQLHK